MTALLSEDRCLVEREDRPLGIIVGEEHGYVIYACAEHLWALDRKVFPSLGAAEKQIILRDRNTAPKG